MGQNASHLVPTVKTAADGGPTALVTTSHHRQASADTDPFHRSPISPRLYPTLPPSATGGGGEEAVPTLPAKPTLGVRIARKLSLSAKDRLPIAVAHSTALADEKRAEVKKRGDPLQVRMEKFEQLVDGLEARHKPNCKRADTLDHSAAEVFGDGLASSLGSSTGTQPSATIITPPASAACLHQPRAAHGVIHFPEQPQPLHPGQLQQSSLHRHSPMNRSISTTTGRSGTAQSPSGKTRTRAEREWRARVAAISAAAKTQAHQHYRTQATMGSRGSTPGPATVVISKSPRTPVRSGTMRDAGAGQIKANGESPVYKGPVPPRRRPTPGAGASDPAQASASHAPLDLVRSAWNPSGPSSLPPHLAMSLFEPSTVDSSPGGKSFTSVRSFETLGHHPNVHLRAGGIHRSPSVDSPVPLRLRTRKPSVPRSVTSSLFDPLMIARTSAFEPGSGSGTRPVSLAASTFLSPLRQAETSGEMDRNADLEAAASHEDIADVSNESPSATRDSPVTPVPRDDKKLRESIRVASAPGAARARSGSAPIVQEPLPRANVIFAQVPDGDHSDQGGLARPAIFAFSSSMAARSPDKACSTTSPAVPPLQTTTPTPQRSVPDSTPSPVTPHSPMTAYILSAPMIDIAFPSSADALPRFASDYASDRVDESDGMKGKDVKPQHPFAAFLDAQSPPRPALISNRSGPPRLPPGYKWVPGAAVPICAADIDLSQLPLSLRPKVRVVTNRATQDPIHTGGAAGGGAPRGGKAKGIQSQHQPQPLRPRSTNRPPAGPTPRARDAILGAPEKQMRTKGRVNLCPGSEDGMRPPKRGMDVSDLERWLAGTTVSD